MSASFTFNPTRYNMITTSTTFTVPAGVYFLWCMGWNGGGGGGGGGFTGNIFSYGNQGAAGGGGGAGAKGELVGIVCKPGDVLTIVIGAGGAGGSAHIWVVGGPNVPSTIGSNGGLTYITNGSDTYYFNRNPATAGGGGAGTGKLNGNTSSFSLLWGLSSTNGVGGGGAKGQFSPCNGAGFNVAGDGGLPFNGGGGGGSGIDNGVGRAGGAGGNNPRTAALGGLGGAGGAAPGGGYRGAAGGGGGGCSDTTILGSDIAGVGGDGLNNTNGGDGGNGLAGRASGGGGGGGAVFGDPNLGASEKRGGYGGNGGSGAILITW